MSFSKELFERLRLDRKVTWGRPLRTFDSTPSTNDLALEAAESDAKTGIVWVAEEQTAGRGRRGQNFSAPPGQGLWFSTLLRYPGSVERLVGLSLVVGLAVRDAVVSRLEGSTTASASIKWPNDVYVGDQKLAGILVETRRCRGSIALVVGIGLNTETRAFPHELAHATSLALLGVEARSRESLLVDILGAMERRLPRFFAQGFGPFHDELARVDYLKGRTVRVDDWTGVAAGIDDRARLILRTDGGQSQALVSGHVSLCAIASP